MKARNSVYLPIQRPGRFADNAQMIDWFEQAQRYVGIGHEMGDIAIRVTGVEEFHDEVFLTGDVMGTPGGHTIEWMLQDDEYLPLYVCEEVHDRQHRFWIARLIGEGMYV